MEKRDTPFQIKAVSPARDGAAPARTMPTEQARQSQPAFEWQALLLRYLPEPLGPSHSIKRFALR
jgi:hypothetical protein